MDLNLHIKHTLKTPHPTCQLANVLLQVNGFEPLNFRGWVWFWNTGCCIWKISEEMALTQKEVEASTMFLEKTLCFE